MRNLWIVGFRSTRFVPERRHLHRLGSLSRSNDGYGSERRAIQLPRYRISISIPGFSPPGPSARGDKNLGSGPCSVVGNTRSDVLFHGNTPAAGRGIRDPSQGGHLHGGRSFVNGQGPDETPGSYRISAESRASGRQFDGLSKQPLQRFALNLLFDPQPLGGGSLQNALIGTEPQRCIPELGCPGSKVGSALIVNPRNLRTGVRLQDVTGSTLPSS